jgi:hypothetical protein
LKYCFASPTVKPNIKDCILKLAYKIRTKEYLQHQKDPTNPTTEYIPQLYIKLKGWHPPPASPTIEKEITQFEKKIKEAVNIKNLRKRNYTDLTPSQRNTLYTLKTTKEFVIDPSDKNLGPAIINHDKYKLQVLQEHLLTSTYWKLDPTTAHLKNNETKLLLLQNYKQHKHLLTKPEVEYFQRSFKEHHRIPIFYGMPKVHKQPINLRPVVSCINSFPAIFSKWLDYKMKQLLHLVPSYIKDSTDLLQELQNLYIPPGAKLFTADAITTYTNINTETGINAIENILFNHQNMKPTQFPKELFLTTLKLVMENNIFSFSDTFWIQLQGTAMGTPAEPLYSILSYSHHENSQILNKFNNNLIYYKRFIDDVLGVWLPTTELDWLEFKSTLNQFGTLKWNINNLSHSTTFLDLQLTIEGNKIKTKTFQKPMNLYLYIPPLSAHSLGCFKRITGELLRYWN